MKIKKSISDSELLSILDENEYLDEEIQNDLYSQTDIVILYKAISEVSAILSRKKFKHNKGKESFLSSDNEDNLRNFLFELHEQVRELNLKISEAIFDILKS